MWKLTYFEFKKIFKSKINIILVLLVFASSLYMVHNQTVNHYNYSGITNEKGQEMSAIEIYRYIDEFQREHAGEITESFIKDMYKLKDSIIQENDLEGYDEAWMIEHYGENYEELLVRLDNNDITQEELDEKLGYLEAYQDYNYIYKVNNVWQYETKLKAEGFNSLLYQCTLLNYMEDILSLKNTVITKDLIENSDNVEPRVQTLFHNLSMVKDLDEDLIDLYNQKIQNMPMEFDSIVGASILYRMFVSSNVFPYMMILLLVLILCSGIFSFEKKSESLLMTTQKGYKQVTIAKIITSLIISISAMVLYYGIVFVYVNSIVPIGNLNISCFSDFLQTNTFTYAEVLKNAFFIVTMASIATGLVATFLSCMTKNRFGTIVPLLIVNFVSIIIYDVKLLEIIPFKMIYVNDLAEWYSFGGLGVDYYTYSSYVNVGNMFIHQKMFVSYIWIFIVIVLCVICYLKQKRHIVK